MQHPTQTPTGATGAPPSLQRIEEGARSFVSKLLNMAPESLDARKKLNEYGFTSLQTVELAKALSSLFGQRISPALIYAHPSIAALAKAIHGGPKSRITQPSFSGDNERGANEPIAIVGMSCRFPGAPTVPDFWNMLCNSQHAIREVPANRWNQSRLFDPNPDKPGRSYIRYGGFLDDVSGFDPACFNISPREAQEMDPQQRLLLELAWEALEDAGFARTQLERRRVGVFIGAIWQDYGALAQQQPSGLGLHSATGQSNNILANRLSYFFDLHGPSLTVDTACSSSLVALHLACQSVRSGESEAALVGGVNLMLSPSTMVALSKFGGVSKGNQCRAFDAAADGFIRGEGGGVLVVKPLSAALRDGDDIYCTVLGSATSSDGATQGLTAPNPDGQLDAITRALNSAQVHPNDVAFVETHGAGTQLGDPIEATALSEAYGEEAREQALVLGSVKTNIGHLEGAAGIAGVIKTALCIHHGQIPATLNFSSPNPHIPFEEWKLRVPTILETWQEDSGERLAGVSSFGWGGTNCHAILGEPLRQKGSLETSHPSPLRSTRAKDERLLFVCSPQGGQWHGMALSLLESFPAFRARVERFDIEYKKVSQHSLLDRLIAYADDGGDTEYGPDTIQPLITMIELGIAAIFEANGVVPDAVVGHSLGEITAARLSGALTDSETALLLFHYTRLQATTDRTGTMAIVECERSELIRRWPELTYAGSNSPTINLISGNKANVTHALSHLQSEGRFARDIDVNVAAHSPTMDTILEELQQSLTPLEPRASSTPMLSTVTSHWLKGTELGAEYWPKNLREPVEFSATLSRAICDGYTTLVELSPSAVLLPSIERNEHCVANHVSAMAAVGRDYNEEQGIRSTLAKLASPEKAGPTDSQRHFCFPLSAHSPEALAAQALNIAETLKREPPPSLQDLAYTLGRSMAQGPYRSFVVAKSHTDLLTSIEGLPNNPHPRRATAVRGPVLVFPGQGGQWAGMARELMDREPVFRQEILSLRSAMQEEWGHDLLERIELATDDELRATGCAQPMVFAMQIALTQLLRSWGVVPAAVVGHSMGEITAAHVAGALSLPHAIQLICKRSKLLGKVSGHGAMLATELTQEQAAEIIGGQEHLISVAVVNSPRSTVLSGDRSALERIFTRLEDEVFCRWVRVDVASHSPQMDPLLDELSVQLIEIAASEPDIPMHSTVTGCWLSKRDLTVEYWLRNLRDPVLFADAVSSLQQDGHRQFLEVSPHPVLSPAIDQCVDRDSHVLNCTRRNEPEQAAMLTTLGGLYQQGLHVDWAQVQRYGGKRLRLPPYPFQRTHHWLAETHSHFPQPCQPSRGSDAHPVIGQAIELASEATTAPPSNYSRLVWQQSLSPETLHILSGHRLGGTTVVSAAVFMDLLATAGRRALNSDALEMSLSFCEPLHLTTQAPMTLQVTAVPTSPDETQIRIFSRVSSADTFTLHVEAYASNTQLGYNLETPSSTAIHPLPQPDNNHPVRLATALYDQLKSRGVEFEPALQTIKNWNSADEQGYAQIRGRGHLGGEHAFDPPTLEGCWQLLAACLPPAPPGSCFVPVSVANWWLAPDIDQHAELHVRAATTPSSAGSMAATLQLYAPTGTLVGALHNIDMRAMPLPRPSGTEASNASTPSNTASTARKDIEAQPEGSARRDFMLALVRKELAQILHTAPQEIDSRAPFKSMGLTSLMGMEFRNRLDRALDLSLSATIIWNYPDLERLVPYLAKRMNLDLEPRLQAPNSPQAHQAQPNAPRLSDIQSLDPSTNTAAQAELLHELAKIENLLQSGR